LTKFVDFAKVLQLGQNYTFFLKWYNFYKIV